MMRSNLTCGACVLAAFAAFVGGCRRGHTAMQIDPAQAYVDARSTLLQMVDDRDARARTHALEALAATEGASVGAAFKEALKDDRLPVLSAAAMAVGKTRYVPAKERLLELAERPDVPAKLKCALIYALHRLGDDRHTSELASLLRDPEDKWVRAEAVKIMGLMSEPSAIGPLKSLQDDEHEVVVRLQVFEALALLDGDDERSLGMLEAYSKSQFMEDKIIAIEALGKLRHRRAIMVLRRLVDDRGQDVIVRVAAAGSLAQLGDVRGYAMTLRAAVDPEAELKRARGRTAPIQPDEVAILQTRAVMALAHMGDLAAVDHLHPLLHSSDPAIRAVSAQTILRLLRSYRPKEQAGAKPKPKVAPKAPEKKKQPPRPRLHTSGAKD